MPDSTLHWGMPVLDSALTQVDDGHLYYRGRDVVSLSAQSSFEEVAAWFWVHDMTASTRLFAAPMPKWPAELTSLARSWGDWTPIDRMMTALPLLARADSPAPCWDRQQAQAGSALPSSCSARLRPRSRVWHRCSMPCSLCVPTTN
jgi:citrate synthase